MKVSFLCYCVKMMKKLSLYTLNATNTGDNLPPSNYPFVKVFLLFNLDGLFIISPFRMKIMILWQKALPPSLVFNPIFSHYQTQNCWLRFKMLVTDLRCRCQIHYVIFVLAIFIVFNGSSTSQSYHQHISSPSSM